MTKKALFPPTDPAHAALEASLRSIETRLARLEELLIEQPSRLAAIELWLTNFNHRLETLEKKEKCKSLIRYYIKLAIYL